MSVWRDRIRRKRAALRLLQTAGREVSRDTGKGLARQVVDMSLLGLRGFNADDYYFLRLYEDPARASHYLTRGDYDVIRRRLNPPMQGVFEFNKWIFGNYCRSLGVPTPECYGVFHTGYGFTHSGQPLKDLSDLAALFSGTRKPIALKPISGAHGNHVMVFDSYDPDTAALRRANGALLALTDLHRMLTRDDAAWLLQEKVRQHHTLARLHASSVNTARVITCRAEDEDAEFVILGAVLRIGVGDAEIDNTTGGGIAARIDLESGTCAAATSVSSVRPIRQHPDSKEAIEGLTLPYWQTVKDVALHAHRMLPFAGTLGWDVAFGEEGPIILEVNGTWYHNHLQMDGQSLRDSLFARVGAPNSTTQ